MSKSISEILAVKDYTELTHEEISRLIDYKCEQAVTRAIAEDRESERKSANEARRKALDETLSKLTATAYEPPVIQVVNFNG